MAITPTGAIYKALKFDGVSSRNYGVYITGEAVFNAPERDVEMITIPGRNGAFALDNGRFQNITVSYPAGIFADNEEDFAEAISEFRNYLCSKRGYCRLQDEYNPGEYRLAIYKDGLEVDPAFLKAGEFTITFECKPQRFLTSGETTITIGEWKNTETESGDIVEVENPDGLLGVKSLSVSLKPIQEGSGTPSPDNVRPISGRTEVVTQRTGKNLLSTKTYEGVGYNPSAGATISPTVKSAQWADKNDGTFSLTLGSWENASLVSPRLSSGTYSLSITTVTAGMRFGIYVVDADGTLDRISQIKNGTTADQLFTSSFAVTDGQWVVVYLAGGSGECIIKEPQLELGSTATDYEPYQGNAYTTALGRTVYGGTLDVVSGELVVDRAMVDLGDWNWTKQAEEGLFYSRHDDVKFQGIMLSSAYDGYIGALTSMPDNSVSATNSQTYLLVRVKDNAKWATMDAAQFKTAVSGVQLVYELATPQTYQLTPQEVSLITGTNNVWSDSGDITLEYGQLPNLLINPTLFESGPLLEVEGTGDITFNGGDITIQAVELGAVQVYGGYTSTSTNPNHIWFDMDMSRLNVGDAVTISGVQVNNNLGLTSNWPTVKFDNLNITETVDIASYVKGPLGSRNSYVNYTPNNFTFYYGTAATSSTSSIKAYMSAHGPNSEGFSYTRTFTYYADYDGNEHIDIYLTYTTYSYFPQTSQAIIPAVMGDSTVSTLPTTVYIDLDIGEAYGEYSGVIASVNNAVILPAELPTLAPGSNAITFDNTITDLKITPRWWKV